MLPGCTAVGLDGDVHADDAMQIFQSIALVVWQVVLRDHAGARDPSAEFHLRQGGVQNLAPDEIEEDVNPVRAMLLQRLLERGRGSVIERRVEAELIDQIADLLVRSRDRKSTRLNSSHSSISYA